MNRKKCQRTVELGDITSHKLNEMFNDNDKVLEHIGNRLNTKGEHFNSIATFFEFSNVELKKNYLSI